MVVESAIGAPVLVPASEGDDVGFHAPELSVGYDVPSATDNLSSVGSVDEVSAITF